MGLFNTIASMSKAAAESYVDSILHTKKGSLWDGLNPNLIAQIYPVDDVGVAVNGATAVKGVFVDDVNLEATLNWSSPFEGAGAEAKAPALMAMLQSGALQSLVDATNLNGTALDSAIQSTKGRTGITKLNSTQVFSGMPSVKIQCNLLFRAWRDSFSEVEQPLNAIMQWALPAKLDQSTTLASRQVESVKTDSMSVQSLMDVALPSSSPTLVGLTYKGRTYAPLVIESVGVPLHSPIDAAGNFIEMQMPITFSTLTAIDANDWLKLKKGTGIAGVM